jgi:hypothetical protein
MTQGQQYSTADDMLMAQSCFSAHVACAAAVSVQLLMATASCRCLVPAVMVAAGMMNMA